MRNEFGAVIERGEILEKRGNRYVVKSYTRDGIVTPPLDALYRQTEYEYEEPVEEDFEYHPGDKVYFFIFPDGNGMILTTFR